jgi:hypothetical protein
MISIIRIRKIANSKPDAFG